MAFDLIHDRGRGPEIAGTRITVYDLLPNFLDAAATEDYICRLYGLTAEQVAAARAYVLNNPESVLAEHLAIEARLAAGNPPEVIEQAEKTHATFVKFREWVAERDKAERDTAAAGSDAASSTPQSRGTGSEPFPTFQQWLAHQGSRPVEQP
jgi:uncharacterized protein (DUF433 family)